MEIRSIRDMQDRMVEKRWGVFNHYLWNPRNHPEVPGLDWDRSVGSFDVDRLARTLHEMGAGYYFITVAHGTEYLLAPNRTYEELLGVRPGTLCPRRDLVADLYEALAQYDIDLFLYFNAATPLFDGIPPEYNRVFDAGKGRHPDTNITHYASEGYVKKWAAVLEEYAVRYGEKVRGWWFDSCYKDYGYDFDLLRPYHIAAKKGNPYSLTAFNNGVKAGIVKWYPDEEMTCGEMNEFTFVPQSRFIDGAQSHMLIPLGYRPDGSSGGWCEKTSKLDAPALREYMDKLHAAGCPLSIDIYVCADGSFEPLQENILRALNFKAQ